MEQKRQALVPLAQPVNLVNVKLLPYQVEGLSWFCAQEDGPYKGGILADEMGKRFTPRVALSDLVGMGKTIQMIALLLLRPMPNKTLVICPVVALIQWKEEIEKYTLPGQVKVLIYHGKLI